MPLQTFSGRQASQNEFELGQFIALLVERKVTRYLEIGARHGDTFHEVMRHLPKGSIGVAVDLPGGVWGKKHTDKYLRRVARHLSKNGYSCKVILGDSTSTKIIEAVRQHAPYGAALIDGDHRYEGVKKDWNNYSDMADIVAFHDIVGAGQGREHCPEGVEVPRLWEELKQELSHREFVAPGSLMGIGVLL